MKNFKTNNNQELAMKYFWVLILSIFLYLPVNAEEEFDFVMVGSSCKILVSYNIISDESLKIAPADTPILFCKRNSKVINCEVTHAEEASEPENRTYQVGMDSPPILFFQADNGSDSAYINTSENAGSFSTRTLGETFMAQKVCSVGFLTYDQYKIMFDSGDTE